MIKKITILFIIISGLFFFYKLQLFAQSPTPPKKIQVGTFEVPTQIPTPTPIPTAVPTKKPTSTPVIINQSTPTPTVKNIPPTSGCENPNIDAVVNSISLNNIQNNLQNLTTKSDGSLQTRYVGTQGHTEEAQFVEQHYTSLGIPFEKQLVPTAEYTNNLIAKIPGKNSNDHIVIVGHFDARGDKNTGNISAAKAVAPGADDNGTGTAAIMEIARAIKTSGFCPKSSIEFFHSTGHEMVNQPLTGTYYYMLNRPAQKRIKSVINMDMIGYSGSSGACARVLYSSFFSESERIANLVSSMNQKYNSGMPMNTVNNSQPSDHVVFWESGIPGVFTFECIGSANPNYHSPSDTFGTINMYQVTNVAKAVAASVVQLANE